jgi:multiple sugar transport system substrate-binding protein
MHIDQLALNAERSVIVPLDDVAQALNLQGENFASSIWNSGIYQGKRYGIPLDTHPLGLYYNKAVMEEGGLDPNKPPQTRDEYMQALEQLKAEGIKGSWVPPNLFTGLMWFQSVLWQFGGDLYNEDVTKATFNSEAGVEALSWMVDLIKDGYSPANVAQDGDVIAFQNGQNAFNWNGIWWINGFKAIPDLEWDVAPLPQIGTERAAWANSHNFVIANQPDADRNRLQAAKVFIAWIVEHSQEWAAGGQVPAANTVRNSEEFQNLEYQPEFAKELPYVHFGPQAPGVREINENILFTAYNSAVLLTADPKSALDTAAHRANQLLQTNQQKYGG